MKIANSCIFLLPFMAKRGRPKKIKSIEPQSDTKFELTLRIGDQDHKLATDNIPEAILEYSPLKIAGKCVMTVKKDGKQFSKIVSPFWLRKLFVNKTARLIFQKQMTQMFQ